jgi:hypothetical protein
METLIILSGSNPLPNLITILHCIKHCDDLDKVVIVSTEDTRQISDSLKALVKVLAEREVQFFQKNISSELHREFGVNRREIEDVFNSFDKNSIHVNFTGGKKWMSVFLSEIGNSMGAELSYLEERGPALISTVPDDLPQTVFVPESIQLKHIIQCHGFSMESGGEDAVASFIKNCLKELDPGALKVLLGESQKMPRFDANKKDRWNELEISEGESLQRFIRDSNQLKNLIDALLSEKELSQEHPFTPDHAIRKADKSSQAKRWRSTLKYLEGQWTELLIQNHLEDFKVQNPGVETAENTWVRPILRTGGNTGQDPEIDIFMRLGWCLVLISVTSSSQRSMVKSKAFEAIHRARQFGGDHARAIMFCGLDLSKSSDLEKDLTSLDKPSFSKLDIVGLEDWCSREKVTNRLIKICEDYLL